MDALIFDFDGVIVDSEPAHLAGFSEALRPMGIELTKEQYCARYLGFDDYECFAVALRDHGKDFTQEQINQMVAHKTSVLKRKLAESILPVPGVVELIRAAATAEVPLAICSGALREEIEIGAETIGVRELFSVVIAAEDVHHSKPDPEGYRIIPQRLTEATGKPVASEHCLAIEDSPMGITAARGAGMKVLGLSTTYRPEELIDADRIVKDFSQVTLESLRELVT